MKTSVKIRIKNNRIYFDVVQNRKHKWIKSNYVVTGVKTKDNDTLKNAEQERAKIEAEYILNDSVVVIDTNTRIKDSRLNFLDYFYEYLQTHSNKLKLLTVYNKLKYFADTRNINLTFRNLDEKFIHSFVEHSLTVRKNHQNTVRNDVVTIKSVLNYAVRNKIIADNKIRFYTVKKHKTVRTYLNIDELNIVIDINNKRNRIINAFIFCCVTGLRYSDVQLIRYSDITKDRDNNYTLNFMMQKTSDTVKITLSQIALEHIDISKINSNDLIFGKITKSTVHSTIKSFMLACNITKHVSFHTSRHTFATLVYKSTRDILVTQKLCGHRDIETTMIYVKMSDDSTIDAIKKFDDAILNR